MASIQHRLAYLEDLAGNRTRGASRAFMANELEELPDGTHRVRATGEVIGSVIRLRWPQEGLRDARD